VAKNIIRRKKRNKQRQRIGDGALAPIKNIVRINKRAAC
jgi:hypothetical protein